MSTSMEAEVLPSRAFVEHVMGMPVSVHVRGRDARGERVAGAVAAFMADLRTAEARFSPYLPDSEVSRLQRGELDLADAHAQLREVERLCRTALERTDGWFDAWHSRDDGLFDPTGLTKTWAVAWAAARTLERVPDVGYALNAGGDVLLRAAPDGEPWMVGVQDPTDTSAVIARIPVTDGAVATSGTAARGAHVLDPHTGEHVTGIVSATVVGPSLLWADVFATALVAMGERAVAWSATLAGTSGMLVLEGGGTHRWANPV